MQKFRNSFLMLGMLAALNCSAQRPDLIMNYIQAYKGVAIAEMQRTGVPAAITLAQGIYESTAGTSELVTISNNHFGIKCKSTWTGESVRHDDDLKNECFRKYPSAEDSYRDHSDFLKNSPRYAPLFSLDPTDYSAWAYGLKKAGYATSPKYPQALIKLIEDYNLEDYTLYAMGRKEDKGNNAIAATPTIAGNDAIINASAVTVVEKVKTWPQGLFRINDLKVIFAVKGTSFLAIAKQYDIDLSKIFEYNELSRAEALDKDQLIFLQRKNKTGSTEFHVVLDGESLYDIAQSEGIRMDCLRELNALKEGEMPAVGEQLSLRKKAVVSPKLAMINRVSEKN